jgi:hypothetical protein
MLCTCPELVQGGRTCILGCFEGFFEDVLELLLLLATRFFAAFATYPRARMGTGHDWHDE